MSNTPETDARTYVPSLGASTVPAEFARQLERERDEVINRLREWSSWCVQYMTERDEAREEIRDWKRLHDAAERGVDLTIAEGTIFDLLKQRDEAREKYDNLATEHMLAVNKLCEERDEARGLHKKSLREREAAERESDATLERAHRAERERDEAREDWYDMQASFERSRDEVEKLTRELAEAREQVNRYRYNLDLLPIKWDI